MAGITYKMNYIKNALMMGKHDINTFNTLKSFVNDQEIVADMTVSLSKVAIAALELIGENETYPVDEQVKQMMTDLSLLI
ncbi:hypothetical protein [Eremococcus coleocola]|uniref:Uncharacterized protein n=1 Tax=Eremococcus coleocola ACS-139-V-Col8 TaxID=908337 RepID=E4KNT5_9LACT|nr:hypothetical protein [Eremococcus coleocola]EFR31317.1 hypothetical protein HMPREF9257_1216 [Eremococcus coleocola ACS-139-V-Col8]